jgi:single-strand DNA-binding protein
MSNQIIITGNLAADPEMRFTPGGDAVANFTVCDTPRKFNKQTQQWEDAGETLFLRCSLWREDAELAAETLRRGQKVTVTGRVKMRTFEKDGEKRTVIECDADSVAPHGARQGAQRQQQAAGDDPWAVQAQQGRAQTSPQQAPGNGWGRPSNDEPPF